MALATFCFPLAWLCLAGAGVAASRLRPKLAAPILLGLLACSVAAFVYATKDASDVLRCGVVFCYKLSADELAKKSTPRDAGAARGRVDAAATTRTVRGRVA